LKGASLAIPSFIIPSQEKDFDYDGFVPLSLTKGFTLGFYPDQVKDLDLPVLRFDEILDLCIDEGYIRKLGSDCKRFLIKEFCSNTVIERFFTYEGETQLLYSDLASIRNLSELRINLVTFVIQKFAQLKKLSFWKRKFFQFIKGNS
jgi:hypothetical protein